MEQTGNALAKVIFRRDCMQHSNVSEGNFIIKKCFIFKMIVFYGIFLSQKPLIIICKYNLKKSLIKPILLAILIVGTVGSINCSI